jgi:DNA-binding SARP family transcriptional activator
LRVSCCPTGTTSGCSRPASASANCGRYGEALLAGLAAVAIEPLRESAHRSVIDVHLAEHNQVEALRQYRAYEQLLRTQLALRPSAELRHLVEEVLAG